jgi:hypothetical protein
MNGKYPEMMLTGAACCLNKGEVRETDRLLEKTLKKMAVKLALHMTQGLAVTVFAAIAIYGIIIYWGGEMSEKLPHAESLTMGLIAVACLVVIVASGGLLDRLAHQDDMAAREPGE